MDFLFVYGTLRQGFRHGMREFMKAHADFFGYGRFQGLLFDLIQYPGVMPSEDTADVVVGEIYKIRAADELFEHLDAYEVCHGSNPIFRREKVTVRSTEDKALQSWIYLFNGSTTGFEVIPSGDYIGFLENRDISPAAYSDHRYARSNYGTG